MVVKIDRRNKYSLAKREFSSGGIVIRRDGDLFSVLLIKDSYGHWTWPKGHIEKGESAKDAAIREIEEETGIDDATILSKIGNTNYYYKRDDLLIYKTVHLYLCETNKEELNIQMSEIKAGKWFTPKEALSRVEYRGAKGLLKKALSKLRTLMIIVLALSCLSTAYADTVKLSDKKTIKGIVIENYADRILYSTIDGEIEILKSNIERIEYDEPFDNLIGLGDSAFERGYYKSALKYYLMAQEIAPTIKSLNDKIYHTETIIYKTPEIKKRSHLALKNEVISYPNSKSPTSENLSPYDMLRKELGISVASKPDGMLYIKGLIKDSPFKKGGILKNDRIVSVWSKLCKYLTLKELYNLLADPHESIITLMIERRITLKDELPFGAKLRMDWEGAIVESVTKTGAAAKAGIKKNDMIVGIADKRIRYTPLNTALGWIDKRTPKTSIDIQRKLTIFKER